MSQMLSESTSAGRVVNSFKKDINEVFVKKYEQKWLDYRKHLVVDMIII